MSLIYPGSSTSNSSNGVEVAETEPLLRARNPSTTGNYGIGSRNDDSDGGVEEVLVQGNLKDSDEEDVDSEVVGSSTPPVSDVTQEKRQLGAISAAFLIFNRVIGTGIFATPSVILRSSGSVGLSLVLWLIGALVAACGTAVYIELGTGIPRSGGEKNYLEFIYRRPRFLATCIYAMYAVLVGWTSASTSVFGEYVLHAINPTHKPSTLVVRLVSLLAITAAFLLHGTKLQWGLKLQNTLGIFKLLVLIGMALSGLAVLVGVPGFRLDNPPNNFEWAKMWEGSLSPGTNAFVTGMYNVIWSFIGYSNANYSLGEVKNPVRTMKLAAPLAMISISVVYFLVNIAYLAVVSKEEILGSGRITAALFFGRLWGPQTERILSGIVAMSILGNILAVLFSMGRVVQELGKEGILPFSSFFATNKPFGTPIGGLLEQWAINSLLVAFVPAGDAYHFMLNLSTYPTSLINMTVSGGLLLLKSSLLKYDWDPPFKSWWFTTCFYFLSNIFLVIAPWIPPTRGFQPYETLPYWLHVAGATSISFIGVLYWYIWSVRLPASGNYRLARQQIVQDDGLTRTVVKKIAL